MKKTGKKVLTNPSGYHKINKHVSQERPCLFPKHRTQIFSNISNENSVWRCTVWLTLNPQRKESL